MSKLDRVKSALLCMYVVCMYVVVLEVLSTVLLS